MPKASPPFRIVRSLTRGGKLYFLYETTRTQYIAPAHRHSHQIDEIRRWIVCAIRNEGIKAFDEVAMEYITRVLGKAPEEVSREERRGRL